jgi:SusD family
MKNNRTTLVAGALLLFGAAACADLDVINSNAPDRERALATPGDVESLIAGSYQQYFYGTHGIGNTAGSPVQVLTTQAFQWSSTAANWGMLQYSRIPRQPVQNSATHADYGFIADSWTRHYRALAAIAEGFRAIQENPSIAEGLEAEGVLRAQIYGKFVQGLAHGAIALLYDRAYIIDESVETIDEAGNPILLGEPVPYGQVMTAALAKLDQAIALSATPGAAGIEIPAEWLASSADLDMATLRRVANSMKARLRASVARNPAERAAVNWTAVLAEVNAGITADWTTDQAYLFNNWIGYGPLYYLGQATWQQMTPFIFGMADQSGNYQRWLSIPVSDRTQVFPDNTPVLFVTPDKRFPQGTTAAAQAAAPGTFVQYRATNAFSRPERGSWRWSFYAHRASSNTVAAGTWPEISLDEMRLLAAEAHYWLGNRAEAANLINVTRVPAGLNATDATGTNTSCVPKLPDGSCGNLLEMLKWEKRIEAWFVGPYQTSQWFDMRGHGDHYKGTPLQFPIPDRQLEVLGLGAEYTFGGVGGQFASTGSTYKWPGE